jgi:hypothetical protein
MKCDDTYSFNWLKWWQWLLLVSIAAGGTLLDTPFLASYPALSGGVFLGRLVINGLVMPYILAYFMGYVNKRSRNAFQSSLWVFAVIAFLLSAFGGKGNVQVHF